MANTVCFCNHNLTLNCDLYYLHFLRLWYNIDNKAKQELIKCLFIDNNNITEYTTLNYYNTDYITYCFKPINNDVNIYISNDVYKKANCQGGFTYITTAYSENNKNEYTIYSSETISGVYNSVLRFDVDYQYK